MKNINVAVQGLSKDVVIFTSHFTKQKFWLWKWIYIQSLISLHLLHNLIVYFLLASPGCFFMTSLCTLRAPDKCWLFIICPCRCTTWVPLEEQMLMVLFVKRFPEQALCSHELNTGGRPGESNYSIHSKLKVWAFTIKHLSYTACLVFKYNSL